MFLDTWALVHILLGRGSLRDFGAEPATTHAMNRLETAVVFLRNGVADPWSKLDALRIGTVGEADADLRLAAQLKASQDGRDRKWSYIDALGYAISQRIGALFLTGDRGFSGLPGVKLLRPS